MPYEEAVEMLKKSIKKMYGKKARSPGAVLTWRSLQPIVRETRW